MKVREVMSNPVITVRPDTAAHAVAELLVSRGFTAAPVVTAEGKMVGIATETDLLRGRIRPGAAAVERRSEPTAAMVMTGRPYTCGPDVDLADVVALMLDHAVRSVPVVDNGRLVGIVSRRDVLRRVARRGLNSVEAWQRRTVGTSEHLMASRPEI
jgi:CBS domain-containing protein